MNKFVVMSGGFHPFHAGHASLYQQAKAAFPGATVLVCATNVQTERPFPFELKKYLAEISGVPSEDFIQVTRQFSAEDPALLQRIGNLDDAIVIFVRSDKDRNEQPQGLPLNPAEDEIPLVTRGPNKGKPQKLLDYDVNKNNLLPASQHTYMAYLKTVKFGPGITSASKIRELWPTFNGKRKLAMVLSLYPETKDSPDLAKKIVQIFDKVMGGQSSVSETKSKVISRTVSDLTNPPKIMQHRSKRDSEREEMYRNAQLGRDDLDDELDTDLEVQQLMRKAQQHYPQSRSKQQAFIKFAQRALKHSEEEDEQQDIEIQKLKKDVNQIKSVLKNPELSESIDYLEEK